MSKEIAEEFADAYKTIRSTFASGRTKDLAWRKWQLKQLWWLIEENEDAVAEAVQKDLGRPPAESKLMEFLAIKTGILAAINQLEVWNKDDIPETGFAMKHVCKARIKKEPRGIVLLIGAANNPFEQSVHVLVSVIAAGCCAIIKPADHNKHTRILVKELVQKYLDTDAYRVINGDTPDMGNILAHRFDHIHFTGGSRTGRIIAAAAAKHLTPTVLELGGQGPAIVCPSADINLAAKRIAWAKVLNMGQICLSVNHVFVHPSVHDEFVDRVTHHIKILAEARESTQLIHESYYDKLERLVSNTKGKIVLVGERDRGKKSFGHVVLSNIEINDPIFEEELFGPVLPIVKADYIQASEETAKGDSPLGLYVFSQDKKEIDYVLNHTLSGGVTVNDVMIHASLENAPFGGVGESGHGASRYEHGFKEFIHHRTIVEIPYFFEKFLQNRYPPYAQDGIASLPVPKASFKRGETMADQKIEQINNGPGGLAAIVGALFGFILKLALGGK